jgi:hypothetical protein
VAGAERPGPAAPPPGPAPAAAAPERLSACLDGAARWLLGSGVRTEDGGFRSIYRPASGTYLTYGGGLSCLQCTAGGVQALLAAAKAGAPVRRDAGASVAAAVASAEHILGLLRPAPGRDEAVIPCGRGAASVKTLHTEAALRALLAVHETTGEGRWLDAARRAARWCVRRLQRRDGSFRSGEAFGLRGRLRARLRDVAPTGAAAFVATLRRIERLTGDRLFGESASRLFLWLRSQLADSGGLPMYRYRPASRLLASTSLGGRAELWRGCLRYHPSPNAWMIEACAVEGDDAGARRVSAWFLPRLGPNGLAYQYYFDLLLDASARGRGSNAPGGIAAAPYGARSVEEDVMPTANLGLQWLRRPDLVPGGAAEEALARIAGGIAGAQVTEGPAHVEGGVRGLPLHPTFNDDIYTWDTVYAVLFLGAYLAR